MDIEILRYAAFTDEPTQGNPAGIVLGERVDGTEMQSIAAEIGYSETAFFVNTCGNDYDVRYFSPLAEVAFCGHATIAGAVALADHGATGNLRFSTPAGLITVDVVRRGGRSFATLSSVPTRSEAAEVAAVNEVLKALDWSVDDLDQRFPPHVAFAGNEHLVLAAATRDRLAHLDYSFDDLKLMMEREGWTTIQLVWRESSSVFHSRNPFPVGGVVEDPATGAAAAALGGYLKEIGEITAPQEITITQGEDMGRRSTILLSVDPEVTSVVISGTAAKI